MWLGIDTGTGSTRALLTDAQGALQGSYTAAHAEMTMEHPLWAEQHPDDWWRAATEAIQGVLRQTGITGDEVTGIGLSGQMHGLVLLDEKHEVIRPALIWCDQRSQAQVDFINATVGKKRVLDYIANPVLTGFTLPKLLWVRDHCPEQYARVRHMLLPKDYIRFRLTGELATDVSDASGTALFDVVKRRWAFDLADQLGVDRAMLPALYESSDVSGTVSETGSELTGLRKGTPVAGGAGDQAASAVGNGIVEPGIVSCTLGTSGVVFAHTEQAVYDPAGRVHTFCHAVRGKWHVMGVTQGAGLSLQWFRNQVAPGISYDGLMAEAATSPAGAQGLFWLPYLMGERTPHLDATIRGGWVGLTARHRRADLIRAVVEGVSYSQQDGLQIIEGLGVPVASVRASGGGANSLFWRQILADVFAKPVVTLASQEGSAYGAALLGMVATGEFASVPEACRATVREVDRLVPEVNAAEVYAAGYRTYQKLYPALRAVM